MGHHGESVSDLAISLKVALDQKEIENMKKNACNYIYIYIICMILFGETNYLCKMFWCL